MAYVCARYPACDSYVMAHPGTLEPMGSLADPPLRKLRYEAHQQFKRIYQSGIMTKRDTYLWLSRILEVPMSQAHIGYLGLYYCQLVIDECQKLLDSQLRPQCRQKKESGGDYDAGAHQRAAS